MLLSFNAFRMFFGWCNERPSQAWRPGLQACLPRLRRHRSPSQCPLPATKVNTALSREPKHAAMQSPRQPDCRSLQTRPRGAITPPRTCKRPPALLLRELGQRETRPLPSLVFPALADRC